MKTGRPMENKVRHGSGGCIEWTGAVNHHGYGCVGFGGKIWLAHRLSLSWLLGRAIVGMACHTCDNPKCVNAAHLYEGDATSNARDMVARGRAGNGVVRRKPVAPSVLTW